MLKIIIKSRYYEIKSRYNEIKSRYYETTFKSRIKEIKSHYNEIKSLNDFLSRNNDFLFFFKHSNLTSQGFRKNISVLHRILNDY